MKAVLGWVAVSVTIVGDVYYFILCIAHVSYKSGQSCLSTVSFIVAEEGRYALARVTGGPETATALSTAL
jgi:hypothetical protein